MKFSTILITGLLAMSPLQTATAAPIYWQEDCVLNILCAGHYTDHPHGASLGKFKSLSSLPLLIKFHQMRGSLTLWVWVHSLGAFPSLDRYSSPFYLYSVLLVSRRRLSLQKTSIPLALLPTNYPLLQTLRAFSSTLLMKSPLECPPTPPLLPI